MAWPAVSTAVARIDDLITKEPLSPWGVEEQVRRLRTELKSIQSFLIDADSRQDDEDVTVRVWVSEIRELAYYAEDVVEDFALKIGSKRRGGFSNFVKRSACIRKEGAILDKTKSKIEEIIAGIIYSKRWLQTHGIKMDSEEGSSSYRRGELRWSYPRIIEDNIVGLDDDIQKLVSILVDEESTSPVVSICGMGGLGKTTLAKKVYNYNQIRSYFNHLAWCYVSQQCQRRRVWEDILSGLISSDELGNFSDEELAGMLLNLLRREKCLVILDGIWTVANWEILKAAFPMRKTRSKILLTSRNREVVLHTNVRGYLHELKYLEEKESWELLQKIAFPRIDSSDYRVDERMEELGKSIVKHCAGLPLTIIVLGGILATKSSVHEWEKVSEHVESYLRRGRGYGLWDLLAWSYNDLPPYLKPCFLYLSHFPNDYEIHAERVVQLWVAEGIVWVEGIFEENGEAIIEHVAEYYLNQLAERCMIQVQERDTNFKIKTFNMYDLMRAFCLSKARQEDFLFIMNEPFSRWNNLSITKEPFSRWNNRRVAAHNFFGILRIKGPHLRSLLIFDDFFPDESHISSSMPLRILRNYFENHEDDKFDPRLWIVVLVGIYIELIKMGRIWTYMLNNFKFLRVLDYEGGTGAAGLKLPSDIGNLIHLRFLSLRDLRFIRSDLPSSLGNLRCLLTLDLRVDSESCYVHVPNVIWKMEQLRHLYLPRKCNPKTKLKLDTLRNLQTLVNFSTRSCYVEDLRSMTSLKKLDICLPFSLKDFKEDLEMNPPILASKDLQSLSVENNDETIDPRHLAYLLSGCASICKLSLHVKISKLPDFKSFPSNISYMYLNDCQLKEDPMPTLGKLPSLRILELHDEVFSGKEMVCSAQCFSQLDSLSLEQLLNLEEWKVDKGAMPALRHLRIQGCSQLKKLPDGLRFIETLQELKIEEMPKAFKDRVVKEGEDFYKVQHVPSTIFHNCDKYL